jgi:hypothetical protein
VKRVTPATEAMKSSIGADLVIAMPVRDEISEPTKYALAHHTPPHRLLTVVGKPVDEARNDLAKQVLALDPVPEFFVWIDDDAWWLPRSIEALSNVLRQLPQVAMVAGSFSRRIPHTPATAWRIAGDPASALVPVRPGTAGGNCTWTDVVQIEECGLHACVVRTPAIRLLGDAPFSVLPALPEDQAFCQRLREHGFEIVCAPGIMFLHYDVKTDLAYAPAQPPLRIEGGKGRLLDGRDTANIRKSPGLMEMKEIVGPDGRRQILVKQRFESMRSYGPAVDDACLRSESKGIAGASRDRAEDGLACNRS